MILGGPEEKFVVEGVDIYKFVMAFIKWDAGQIFFEKELGVWENLPFSKKIDLSKVNGPFVVDCDYDNKFYVGIDKFVSYFDNKADVQDETTIRKDVSEHWIVEMYKKFGDKYMPYARRGLEAIDKRLVEKKIALENWYDEKIRKLQREKKVRVDALDERIIDVELLVRQAGGNIYHLERAKDKQQEK